MAEACERTGRALAEVALIAVSKTVGLAELAEARAVGQHDFAENRTGLFKERQAAYPEERWHFIGSIQTNKIKDFVGRATLVHSLASDHALIAVARRARLLGVVQDVLLEVNVSGEVSKDGLRPTGLVRLLELACSEAGEGLRVRGLMTMAPQGNPVAARASFCGLRTLRDRYATSWHTPGRIELSELSMGMSEDYPLAIEEGATMVRIGRTVWT
jgi:pyridoxal phosphate enzyme (YggS family)